MIIGEYLNIFLVNRYMGVPQDLLTKHETVVAEFLTTHYDEVLILFSV